MAGCDFTIFAFKSYFLFEGRTQWKLKENQFTIIGFRTFAVENVGNISIMLGEINEEDNEGRLIIDTAASKLFLEFTEQWKAY